MPSTVSTSLRRSVCTSPLFLLSPCLPLAPVEALDVYFNTDGSVRRAEYLAEQASARNFTANTKAAIDNYVAYLVDICHSLESVAQEARRVEAGGARAEEVQAVAKALLFDTNIEEAMAAAETLIGAQGVGEHRMLAVEALESFVDGLRGGPLEGARQDRVWKRLRLVESELLSSLRCLPRKCLRDAEEIVENEITGAHTGIFPWRMQATKAESCFDPGNNILLMEMDRR